MWSFSTDLNSNPRVRLIFAYFIYSVFGSRRASFDFEKLCRRLKVFAKNMKRPLLKNLFQVGHGSCLQVDQIEDFLRTNINQSEPYETRLLHYHLLACLNA